MTGSIYLAFSGILVTAAATLAAINDIYTFTGFVAVGASAGVFYSFLGKGGGLYVENRRSLKARVIIGMVGGVGGPRGLDALWLWFHKFISADPILLILAGFVSAWISYSIGHAFFQKLDNRSDAIAASLAKAAEKSAGIQDEHTNSNPTKDSHH